MSDPLGMFAELDAAMLDGLHPAARALATTSDPTTATLAALVGEPIEVQVADQDETGLPWPLFELDATVQNEPVLLQTAWLRGARTGRLWQRAASVVLSGRVDPAVVTQLRPRTQTPVQVLAAVYSDAEQHRQQLRWLCGPAGPKGKLFGLDLNAALATRTYRVLLGTRPVALIAETFPADDWPDVASPTGSAAE